MTAFLSILLCLNTGVTIVHPDRIKKAVEAYVAGRWESKREQFQVEFREVPSAIKVSSSSYSVRVGIGSVPKLKGYVGIPVEIVCNDRVERRIVIPAQVRTYGNVVATNRQLQRHEAITGGGMMSRRLETTGLPEDVIFEGTELEGMRSVRIVGANSVLCASMLERLPVVRQEDAVTISIRTGKAVVTAQGVAKQEGCVGDIIAVQRSGSKERLKATVLDARTVFVEIGQPVPGIQNN